MELAIECKRLKQVREELNETQTSFAKILGVGNTTTDFERGRTKLSGILVLRLLSKYHINPLWLYGESEQKHLNPSIRDINPRVLSVDASGNENILMVNQKAAAGYAGNIDNDDYYQELPAFSFPLPEFRNASFRGFQVEGYSMSPTIRPGEWIITKAVANIDEIKEGNIYVIVDSDGVRIKKLLHQKETESLALVSINKEYTTEIIGYSQIKEIWEFHSKLTKEVYPYSPNKKLEDIHNDIKQMKVQMNKMI